MWALLVAAALIGSDSDLHVAGRSIADWRDRMGRLELESSASAAEIPGLIELVSRRDVPAVTRRQAALVLGRLRPPALTAIPVLLSLLGEQAHKPDEYLANTAIKSLALMGPSAAKAVPALTRHFLAADTPVEQRQMIVEALSQVGAAHPDAVALLIDIAAGRAPHQLDPTQRIPLQMLACEGLNRLGGEGDTAVPVLVRLLHHDDANLQRKAAEALGAIGSRATDAQPALADLAAFSTDELVRHAASEALGLTGPTAWTWAQAWLASDIADLRLAAANMPASWGQPGRITLPTLHRYTNDPDLFVRMAVWNSAVALGDAPLRYSPQAIELLAASQAEVRRTAAGLLITWGLSSPDVRNQVLPLMEHHNPLLQSAARHLRARWDALLPAARTPTISP